MTDSQALRTMCLVVAIILFVLGLAAMGTAQTETSPGTVMAERPKLVPGDTWQWTYGIETFVGQDGDNLVFEYNITRKRYRTQDLNLVKTVSSDGSITQLRDPHSGHLNFPLSLGKIWSHSYASDGVLRQSHYKVAAYELVTVRAGTFMAYRIEGEDKRLDRRFGILRNTWYSPQAKQIVKMEDVDGSNNQPVSGGTFELVRYSAAP